MFVHVFSPFGKAFHNLQVYLLFYAFFLFKDVWQLRDEVANFEQKHDAELIKEAKRYSYK